MDLDGAVSLSKKIYIGTTTLAFLFCHNFRYGGSETGQIGILLLGFITNTLTAVTHSIILAYMIHGLWATIPGSWSRHLGYTLGGGL